MEFLSNKPLLITDTIPVSYTHLDVYKRQVIPLWVNKETVLSLRVEDEQAVPSILIVPDGVFILCDEIIISQQCAAEQPEQRCIRDRKRRHDPCSKCFQGWFLLIVI